MLTTKQFNDISDFFSRLKVLHGPEFVNATLFRHKKLALSLQDYEKTHIIDLESNLTCQE